MNDWRVFVGLGLDEQTRSLLAQVVRELGPLPGRPVPVDNWHVTLRFVGDADEVSRDRLMAALDEGLSGRTRGAVAVNFARLDTFPHPRQATVLWVGIDPDEVGELAAVAEDACQSVGFAAEERPFRPHLTLARIRPPEDVRGFVAQDLGPIRASIEHVTLFRSVLGAGGARYEALERFPL